MGNKRVEFVLTGKIKPYVRQRRGSKRVNQQAAEYSYSQEALRWQMHLQMVQHGWTMLPGQTPLRLILIADWARHNHDLSNLLKAVEDAGNNLIYPDDRWIDEIQAKRSGGTEVGTTLLIVEVL